MKRPVPLKLTCGARISCIVPPLGDYSTYIYAVHRHDSHEIKIGKAVDPVRRLVEIQSVHGVELDLRLALPAHADREPEMHRVFSKWRRLGEWFSMAPEIESWLQISLASLRDAPDVLDREGGGCAFRTAEGLPCRNRSAFVVRVYGDQLDVCAVHNHALQSATRRVP